MPLSDGWKWFLSALAYLIVQLCSNAWTTYRVRQAARALDANTASPTQVARLQADVTVVKNDVGTVKETVLKNAGPDNRGPSKTPR